MGTKRASKNENGKQNGRQLLTIRQISQNLLKTWQQSDPVSALEETLAEILRQVDEEVVRDQNVSAIVYIYETGVGFSSGQARGPLREYMQNYPPRPGGTSEYAIRRREPVFVSDTATMPEGIPQLSQQAQAQGVKSFANLPLLIGQSKQESLVGVLLINLQEPYEFNEERQTLLQLFAMQAAIALQNARVHRRRLREQEALQVISEAAVSSTAEEAGNIIAQQVVTITKADYAALWSANFEQKRNPPHQAYVWLLIMLRKINSPMNYYPEFRLF
jgi:GAF domain-containing protein